MQLKSGSVYSLFGPSAAGKSSTLHVMAGFENQFVKAYFSVNGRVLLDVGKEKHINIPAWRRGVVLVEQGSTLFPHLTVGENIRYGTTAKRDPWLDDWIERFGLSVYLDAKPRELSGGLIQRTVLARAIAGRPKTLLLDEAFSALDTSLRRILQDATLELRDKLGTTVIIVTHQLAEAQRMADQIGIIDHGEILQEGTPEQVMLSPRSWEVAKLLGYTHLLHDENAHRFAFHPNHVIPGAHPTLGPVLCGLVKQRFLHEGEFRIVVETGQFNDAIIEIAVPINADTEVGQIYTFTVPDPPYIE